MKTRKIVSVVFGIYTIIVVLLSLLPSFFFRNLPYVPSWSFTDKIAHVLMYLFYTLIAAGMFYCHSLKRIILLSILYTMFIGVLMEFCQMMIKGAGRTGSFADIVANSFGTIIGALVVYAIIKK
jgi:VanZ family protein